MRKALVGLSLFCILVTWCGWGVAGEKADHVCFRRIDTDHDGKVTMKEFAVHYGTDEAKFKAADSNEDGNLSHDEYHEFLGHGAADKKTEE